jgi:hypothetical protein
MFLLPMMRHFPLLVVIGTICFLTNNIVAAQAAPEQRLLITSQPTTNNLRQRMAMLIRAMPCSRATWGCKDFAERLKAAMEQEGLHGSILQLGYTEKTNQKEPGSDEYITVFRPILSGVVVRIDGQDIMYDRDSTGTPLEEWYRNIGEERIKQYTSNFSTF